MRIRLHPWAGVALTLVLAVALAIAGLVASPRTASQVAPADTSVTRREPEPQADSPQRQDDKAEQASDREASEGEPAQTPPAQDEPQASEPAGQDGEPPAEEASVADDSGPQDAPSPVEAREHTESEVLISVDPQASAAEVEELLARMPGLVPQSVSEEDLRLGAVLVQLEPGVSVEDAVGAVSAAESPLVKGSQPNYVYYLADETVGGEGTEPAAEPEAEVVADPQPEAAPAPAAEAEPAPEPDPVDALQLDVAATTVDDPIASSQWALKSVRAYDAWDAAKCEGSVAVAVFDNGFDLTHEDLAGNIVEGSAYNSFDQNNDVSPINGHGTHVAGIVGAVANNGKGVAGVAYNPKIVPVKVFGADGTANTYTVVRAYQYVLDHPEYDVRVANLSLGAAVKTDDFEDDVLVQSAREALDRGIVSVAAASNVNSGGPVAEDDEAPFYAYPSDSEAFVSVISLSGTASADGNDASGAYAVSRGSSSNYNCVGQGGTTTFKGKNISAPGVSIQSTFPGNLYGPNTGTSMAAPSVAGVVALEFAANPALSALEAIQALYDSAHDIGPAGWDAEYGHGEVDAYAAVQQALDTSVVASLVLPEEGYLYDGSAKEPEVEVKVTVGGETTALVRDQDFSVSYDKNTEAGMAAAFVEGMGAYEGQISRTLWFSIAPRPLTAEMVSLSSTSWVYDAREIMPSVTVAFNGQRVDSSGYSSAYTNNVNEGTGVVTVSGQGNFTGSVAKEFTIAQRPLADARVAVSVSPESLAYTGRECRPDVMIVHTPQRSVNGQTEYLDPVTLVEGEDYTLSYANNVNAGSATVTVAGKGNYKGSVNKTFAVTPLVLVDADVVLSKDRVVVGEAPQVSVTHNGVVLVADTDYTLAIAGNGAATSEATATVVGKGNYQGTVTKTFAVVEGFLDDGKTRVEIEADGLTYTGQAIEPAIAVYHNDKKLAAEDYDAVFVDNVAAGKAKVTVTGKGKFAGTVSGEFQVAPAAITSVTAPSQTYNGKARMPVPEVKAGSLTLAEGDYDVSYENNVGPGTAKVKVVGKGNFCGEANGTFSIAKAANPVVASAKKANLSVTFSPTAAQNTAANVTVSKAQGTVSYANASSNATAKRFLVNASTGAVSVPKGTAAGAYLVVVKVTAAGDKNHNAGSKTCAFTVTVNKAAVANAVVGTIGVQAYTGKAVTPRPTVTFGGVTLRLNADYALTYANNVKAGNATVTVVGGGNYSGSKKVSFRIVAPSVTYRTHVQTYGDQAWKTNGQVSGTFGQSKRLEGIWIKVGTPPVFGSIQYCTHVQRIGWQSWRNAGVMSGTSGMSRRLEAIQIRLTGTMAQQYDVWYRVHAQKLGWMGWTKNGARAGTAGYSYRLEGIQILLTPKNASAPSANYGGYKQMTRTAFAQR